MKHEVTNQALSDRFCLWRLRAPLDSEDHRSRLKLWEELMALTRRSERDLGGGREEKVSEAAAN